MSKRPLKPDEKRAWAQVAKTIRAREDQPPPEMPPLEDIFPLDAAVKPTAPKKPLSRPVFHPHAAPRAPIKHITAPIHNRGKERRIRRGQAPISATIDLHGHTRASAQSLLIGFLTSQRRQGASCVLVITGKGRLGEGVLRRQLLQWLGTDQARDLVNGYSEAHRKHGGSGAWYIFLRKEALP